MIPIKAISEALRLLPSAMDSREARIMLIAIGLQESKFLHRRQLVGSPPRPVGPATGLWQFEKMGGVYGALNHRATKRLAEQVCAARGLFNPNAQMVWEALQIDDVLAAAFARLLLWTDPKALPKVGDSQAAWDVYLRVWRPGKPHRGTWDAYYAQAVAA